MQHYSKRSSFAEKVLFSKKKKRKKKNETCQVTTSTSHSFSHCKRCSLRFFLPLQREKREKLPFGPLLASPRFSPQLQDFAAVSMETAALRVQKAKSCSRVTRALVCALGQNRISAHDRNLRSDIQMRTLSSALYLPSPVNFYLSSFLCQTKLDQNSKKKPKRPLLSPLTVPVADKHKARRSRQTPKDATKPPSFARLSVSYKIILKTIRNRKGDCA